MNINESAQKAGELALARLRPENLTSHGRRLLQGGRFTAEKRAAKLLLNLNPPNERGCIEWRNGKSDDGYGKTSIRHRSWSAHRLFYNLFAGDSGAMWVLHKCDNPPCCNPEHLFLGTGLDNIQDCISKGRLVTTPGELNGFSKLTESDVTMIRSLYKRGSKGEFSLVGLAEKFNCDMSNIGRIVRGETWQHLAYARQKGKSE